MPWFPYSNLDGTARPFLAVWRDQVAPMAALIDSGADGSCLPLAIAQLLGVRYDPNQPRTAIGAGGQYQEYVATADVPLVCACGPLVLTRPAINPWLPYILLGRLDAFAAYQFAFNQRTLMFQIEPYPALPA